MNQCTYCGTQIDAGRTVCDACRDDMIRNTWKRQIRAYGMLIGIGLVLLVYAWFQFTGQHYTIGDAPLMLKAAVVLGGLGLMGGLFGLALAVFFNIWHARGR